MLGGEALPLRSGALHYWRINPERWPAALAALKKLGLRIVETYVPWGVHELEEGVFDFGERDPRKDLSAFLDAVEEAGMYAFLRPGPHINAELTYFGLPERITSNRDMQARSPRGNAVALYFPPRMFAVPSHASEAYHDAVASWFEAAAEHITPRLYPDGPVVLLQVDNEGSYYFRNGPFCQDYHPDALRQWHSFARGAGVGGDEEETAAPSQLGQGLWGEDIAGEELHRHMTWASFQEHSLTQAIGRMKQSMQRAGMRGVPFVHNLALGEGGLPLRVPALSRQVDAVGFDYYHAARDHEAIKRRTLYLSANTDAAFAPELGVGAPPWFTPLKHEDSLFTAMTASAYGLRAFNLYMAVDRERWYGGIIDQQGRARPHETDWSRFLAALEHTHFHTLEREAHVALVVPAEYARLSRATHVLGPLSPSILEAGLVAEGQDDPGPTAGCRADELGLGTSIQRDWWCAMQRVATALTEAGVPFTYLDSQSPARYWRPYRLFFSPSFRFVDGERWSALGRAKGHAVVGPEQPTLNSAFEEAEFEALDTLDVFDERALRATIIDWIDRFELQRPYATKPPIETCVHSRDGRDVVLFVINGSDASHEARIRLPRASNARDLMTRESFDGDESLVVPMAPRSVRMLELASARASTPPRARRNA